MAAMLSTAIEIKLIDFDGNKNIYYCERKAEPNKVHRIKNNKIVSSDKDTEPAVEPGTS